MQHTLTRRRTLPLVVAAACVAAYLLREVLFALAVQLLAGYGLMALALPLCRLLERWMKPALASGLSLLLLGVAAAGLLLAVIPPMAAQFRQLAQDVPALMDWCEARLNDLQRILGERGIDLTLLREAIVTQLSQSAGTLVGQAAQAVGRVVQAASKLLLAPLIGFYLLKDRRRIASGLTLLIPVQHRARAVRAAREMRRETANFLRGQLMLSLAVGGLTAAGLLIVGTPGWLALGALMGVLELIPYLGPILAGIPAVLLALQGGFIAALWTLIVLVAVQQIESGVLSPRLLSGATRLHPLTVLLSVSAGGMLGGPLGMVLSLPVVVSIRGALRGLRS